MAEHLLAHAREPLLVVAGNLHAALEPHPRGTPMGAALARRRPGVRAIRTTYRRGTFYNLGERRFLASAAGDPATGVRLSAGTGLELEVPGATAAHVPHSGVATAG